MTSAAQTFTARIAPGVGDPIPYVVQSFDGRTLIGRRTDTTLELIDVFTKRRNGNFAVKGGGQWEMYLSAERASALVTV